jgi:hypothetical protein
MSTKLYHFLRKKFQIFGMERWKKYDILTIIEGEFMNQQYVSNNLSEKNEVNYHLENNNAYSSFTQPDFLSYELQKENSELKIQLQQKGQMVSLKMLIILILLINLGWFLGVKLIIYPKFKESVELHDQMKDDYLKLKSRVNAIVGEE